MLLGAIFGYVFYWSKSLWLPILGHFINNASALLLGSLFPDSIENADGSIFENNQYSIIFYIGSFMLSAVILYLIWQKSQKNSVDIENKTSISV